MLEERMRVLLRDQMAKIPTIIDERIRIHTEEGRLASGSPGARSPAASSAGERLTTPNWLGAEKSDLADLDADLGRRIEERFAETARQRRGESRARFTHGDEQAR